MPYDALEVRFGRCGEEVFADEEAYAFECGVAGHEDGGAGCCFQ